MKAEKAKKTLKICLLFVLLCLPQLFYYYEAAWGPSLFLHDGPLSFSSVITGILSGFWHSFVLWAMLALIVFYLAVYRFVPVSGQFKSFFFASQLVLPAFFLANSFFTIFIPEWKSVITARSRTIFLAVSILDYAADAAVPVILLRRLRAASKEHNPPPRKALLFAGAVFFALTVCSLITCYNTLIMLPGILDPYNPDGLALVPDTAEIRGSPDGATPGDICLYGKYPPGENPGDGEPVQWIVLRSDDTGVLLLSRYILGYSAFGSEGVCTDFMNSDIRVWLNDDFMNEAFTEEEKARLGYADGENHVSLLGYEETCSYFASSFACRCAAADYIILPEKTTPFKEGSWWMKDVGPSGSGCAVTDDGAPFSTGIDDVLGVRPLILVRNKA